MAVTLPNPFNVAELTALLRRLTGEAGDLTVTGDPTAGGASVSSTTWPDPTITYAVGRLPYQPREPGAPAPSEFVPVLAGLKQIWVSDQGDDSHGGLSAGTPVKTFAKALAVMGTGVPGIIHANGTIDMGPGQSMSGYSCGIIGLNPQNTVLQTSAPQTGPVLDMDGFVSPAAFIGKVPFRDFTVSGDSQPDATLTHKGINLVNVSATSFARVVVNNTGGPGLFLGTQSDLNEFDGVVLTPPIGCDTNSVPWLHIRGTCNSNTFNKCGLSSTGSSNDGPFPVLIEDDGTGVPILNSFNECWSENVHVPTNGRIVVSKGNLNHHNHWYHYDPVLVAGATGTAQAELAAPAVTDEGGNSYTGVIDGADPLAAGLIVSQSNNAVIGVKGQGTSPFVTLAAGVTGASVRLFGSYGAPTSGIADNSGTPSNFMQDMNTLKEGGATLQVGNGGAGLYIRYTAASGNPTLMLANSTGKQWEFRVDEASNELVVDYWNGGARTPGIIQWNIDGTLLVKGGLGFSPATATVAPAAGAAAALPATPSGYMTVSVDGTDRQVAFY